MLRLAWPVLVEQLLVMMVGLVDLWLTGNYLAEPHLAAIGLMSYVLWLIPCMFGVVSIGAMALTARLVGAEDFDGACRVTNQAIVLGAGLAVVVTGVVYGLSRPFLALIQLPEDAVPLALQYLWIITPVVPAIMIEVVGIGCLRGAGDTLSGFFAMALVNAVNIVVGAGLVIGIGPLPRIGWPGLAIGTASGYATGALTVLLMLIFGRCGLQLRWSLLRPDPGWIRRILRIGLPGGIDQTAVVFCHMWFLSIINSLGTIAAAAHGLGVRIESLSYLPGAAFQVAAATLAGQFLGAGDRRRATRGVLATLLVGGGIMMAAAIPFYFNGRWLTGLFLGQQTQSIAALTVPLLKIVAIAMPMFAIGTILTGALRGAGDTRWPLLFTFVGFLLVRIPLAYLLAWDQVPIPGTAIILPGFGWGVIGAWLAMLSDVTLRGILITWRFLHGGWQRIVV